MSVRSICAIALVLFYLTKVNGDDRVQCGAWDFARSLENIFTHPCRDVKHTECVVCPAHWYVECPSGYVHKTYRSCGFLLWGCKLECVREWRSCDKECKGPLPRYYTRTPYPSPSPTPRPSRLPTRRPTNEPTKFPTIEPTPHPTDSPTDFPTETPTPAPTDAPSQFPTKYPSLMPTLYPTGAPTVVPTMEPGAPSPEEVCAAVGDKKKTCKVTSGCYFGHKANGPCSLFRGVCEEIKNKKTCRSAEPCVFEFDSCRSKSVTTHNPTYYPTFVPSTLPTPAPSTSLTSAPSMSHEGVSEFCIVQCALRLHEAGVCHDSVTCKAEGADFCHSFGEENAREICEDDSNW